MKIACTMPHGRELHLRGRYFWNQLTPATNKRAIEYYEQAVALDPNYALAWPGLADVFTASPINSDVPPLQASPRAREAAANAVRAEPNLAETQSSLCVFKFFLVKGVQIHVSCLVVSNNSIGVLATPDLDGPVECPGLYAI